MLQCIHSLVVGTAGVVVGVEVAVVDGKTGMEVEL